MNTSARIGYSKNTRRPSATHSAIVVGVTPFHSGARSAGIAGMSPAASWSARSRVTGIERGFHAGNRSQPRVPWPYAARRIREYSFAGFVSDASSAARRAVPVHSSRKARAAVRVE